MFVGTARFVIHIPAAQSLKDRRRVVNKLKDRIRARLAVSLCEIGDADRHQVARIAVVTVARDADTCRRVLDAARSMADTQSDAWLTDTRSEVLSFGAGGDNLGCGIESDPRDELHGGSSGGVGEDEVDVGPSPGGCGENGFSAAGRKHRGKDRD